MSAELQTQPTQLARMIEQNRLGPVTAQQLQAEFCPLFERRDALLQESAGIVVTDASQTDAMEAADKMRRSLKGVRGLGEAVRKKFKEDFLRGGKAIDGIGHLLNDPIEVEERRLEEAANFAAMAEAKRKAELQAARADILRLFGPEYDSYPLGDMTNEAFGKLHRSLIVMKEADEKAAREAEEGRKAQEARQQEQQAKIRQENARLRQEADAREAAFAEAQRKNEVERKAIEDKARAERQAVEARAAREREAAEAREAEERKAREAAEKALAEKAAAEASAKTAAEAARRKAERAPDNQKLAALAATIRAVAMPTVTSPEAKATVEDVGRRLAWIANKLETDAGK